MNGFSISRLSANLQSTALTLRELSGFSRWTFVKYCFSRFSNALSSAP